MIQCVDKYEVRKYVKKKGLKDLLIPCYGVYDSIDQIDWDFLPNSFAMKDTLGGGGAAVIIVKNKQEENIEAIKEQAKSWTKIPPHKRTGGREWPYYSGKSHRIIIEKYIESDDDSCGLVDYKFFCFNGHVKYIYVMADRILGNGVGTGIFDEYFNKIDAERADERPLKVDIRKPQNFEQMKEIAETLSGDFPEVRIDLYNNQGRILFGEITFYDGSGYMTFKPDSFDYRLGEPFVLKPYINVNFRCN